MALMLYSEKQADFEGHPSTLVIFAREQNDTEYFRSISHGFGGGTEL